MNIGKLKNKKIGLGVLLLLVLCLGTFFFLKHKIDKKNSLNYGIKYLVNVNQYGYHDVSVNYFTGIISEETLDSGKLVSLCNSLHDPKCESNSGFSSSIVYLDKEYIVFQEIREQPGLGFSYLMEDGSYLWAHGVLSFFEKKDDKLALKGRTVFNDFIYNLSRDDEGFNVVSEYFYPENGDVCAYGGGVKSAEMNFSDWKLKEINSPYVDGRDVIDTVYLSEGEVYQDVHASYSKIENDLMKTTITSGACLVGGPDECGHTCEESADFVVSDYYIDLNTGKTIDSEGNVLHTKSYEKDPCLEVEYNEDTLYMFNGEYADQKDAFARIIGEKGGKSLEKIYNSCLYDRGDIENFYIKKENKGRLFSFNSESKKLETIDMEILFNIHSPTFHDLVTKMNGQCEDGYCKDEFSVDDEMLSFLENPDNKNVKKISEDEFVLKKLKSKKEGGEERCLSVRSEFSSSCRANFLKSSAGVIARITKGDHEDNIFFKNKDDDNFLVNSLEHSAVASTLVEAKNEGEKKDLIFHVHHGGHGSAEDQFYLFGKERLWSGSLGTYRVNDLFSLGSEVYIRLKYNAIKEISLFGKKLYREKKEVGDVFLKIDAHHMYSENVNIIEI